MAGYKLKTHSGAKKRFKITGSGKIMRRKAGRRHILTSKARDRKRRLKGRALVDPGMVQAIKRLMPYSS
ncbi:MAG TPA: 50S ribosomal protein L35 [Nitrospiraceae bacterium]|jgi:large subunit ribosomal protein L35|nr:50S ribosomal protein L35 [Nitrospiraceae bacterium]